METIEQGTPAIVYVAPTVSDLGSFVELTESKSGSVSDFAMGQGSITISTITVSGPPH